MTTQPKPGQMALPNMQIQMKNASGVWVHTDKIPSQGRYRLIIRKQPPRSK